MTFLEDKSTHKPTFATINSGAKRWSEMDQKFLGVISWELAVKWAKKKKVTVRLCHSKGYENQGYYIN